LSSIKNQLQEKEFVIGRLNQEADEQEKLFNDKLRYKDDLLEDKNKKIKS